MPPNGEHIARQLWGPVRTTTSYKGHCTPFSLPSGGRRIIPPSFRTPRLTVAGVIRLNESVDITLTQNAQFGPLCTATTSSRVDGVNIDNATVVNFRDPFYASIAPQFFAIAAATVVAYLLVIIIFITPGTFFVGGPGGGRAFLGRRGMISGTYGSSSVVGIGRRPWLQKIAAITVAISLTIASADTFKYCHRQYDAGYSDAGALVEEVNAGLEIRVVRVISDTFLWLAQVQTLIRLFPRHKEKVAIKWLGFALILFDTVFSILNNFVYQSSKTRPRRFEDAIPALSYLFELSIGLIYAACVIYYSMSKRRFAFWHVRMRNICLVAFCSLMAVLVPVVFFVLDITNADVATWGGYIRWVGAAAASVVVWEWVERIEALERDERKDGILGREIFDGDEMLDTTPSEEVGWPGRSQNRRNGDEDGAGDASGWANSNGTAHRPLRSRVPFQSRPSEFATPADLSTGPAVVGGLSDRLGQTHPTVPPQAITPVSRADTSSASTVYAVRRLPPNTPSPQIPEDSDPTCPALPKGTSSIPPDSAMVDMIHTSPAVPNHGAANQSMTDSPTGKNPSLPTWRAVPNPFKRRRAFPPAEVAGAQSAAASRLGLSTAGSRGRPSTNARFSLFAMSQKRKLDSRGKGQSSDSPLEVTVIPAQRRGQRTWSPDDFTDSDMNEGDTGDGHKASQVDGRDEVQSTHLPSNGADLPVTFIPARSSNQRTWSPQDLDERPMHAPPQNPPAVSPVHGQPSAYPDDIGQGTTDTLQETQPEPPPDQSSRDSVNGSDPSRSVLSRRGTVVIKENGPRDPSG
jgi:hypothetical protein